MKKLLIASTALSLAGGAAFAEMAITVSGDAEMGVDYASEPAGGASKHSFVHEVGIDFTASGTTDGGLTFGGSAGFDTKDTDLNTGTVNVSGSFGTLTIGDNDAADLTAGGIADIGMNGIGVDDMVEGLRGTTAGQLRYDNSFGQVSIAISAGTKAGSAAVAAVPASEWHITGPKTGDMMTTYIYRPDFERTVAGVATLTPAANSLIAGTSNPLIMWDPDREMYVGEISTQTGATDSLTTIGTALSSQTMNELDKLFGVVHRHQTDDDGQVVVDIDFVVEPRDAVGDIAAIDAAGAAKDQVDIYGYSRSDDGKILNADGETVGADTPAGKAFTRYETNYDLGTDKKVGGKDGEAATAKAADTVKVASNAVAAVPAVASDTEYAFGMSFNAGGVTIGVGYDSNKTVNMGAGFTTGEITTNLLYVKTEDDEDTPMVDEEMTGMGVDMAYAMGASTVTLSYGRRKPETGEAMDAVGMGVTHDLGGGATLNAGFGKVDKKVGPAGSQKIVGENKASIGLMFTF